MSFLGTVTSIEVANTGDPRKRWVVTTRVDRIDSGSFSGSAFSFAIHSPAKSGLEVGKQYSIRAVRTRDGYLVDQYQWSGPGDQRGEFLARIHRIYDFEPSKVSEEDRERKSREMDAFWKEVEENKENLLPVLREALRRRHSARVSDEALEEIAYLTRLMRIAFTAEK